MASTKRVRRVNTIESDSDSDTKLSTCLSRPSRPDFQHATPQPSSTRIHKQNPPRKRNRLTFVGGIEADSDDEFDIETTAVSGAPGKINVTHQAYSAAKKPCLNEQPRAPPPVSSDIPSRPINDPEPIKRNQVCPFCLYMC